MPRSRARTADWVVSRTMTPGRLPLGKPRRPRAVPDGPLPRGVGLGCRVGAQPTPASDKLSTAADDLACASTTSLSLGGVPGRTESLPGTAQHEDRQTAPTP